MAFGVVAVALGWLWDYQFPVIKKIWTSSYVLVAGGYSAILLGAFYLIVDVWRWHVVPAVCVDRHEFDHPLSGDNFLG